MFDKIAWILFLIAAVGTTLYETFKIFKLLVE
jgi:hypothetical protein